ncbi:DUF2273 domain-containing protein [Bombilactobacillus bombi]|uniref:DUF2273 domain-containing protein n=1 Tax=Bombilactobacillus bombi TaxID=1303590 RepID=UPI0015E60C26|nr:DUF2273 domain-containing protein [Bombilactobacillus bombi]MBA1434473.1 DUF2273 domain-containing protein [Bombilactobacillus bombi]
MKNIWEHYAWEVIGSLIGLLIAIGCISIGFVKTIFILFFVIIGGLIGHYGPQLLHLIQKN